MKYIICETQKIHKIECIDIITNTILLKADINASM